MEKVLEEIARIGVVPVVAVGKAEQALPLADALLAGGIGIVEVTFRTAAAAEAIRLIAAERPGLIAGAGTVLSPETLAEAKRAGAKFCVAPGLNEDVVRAAEDAGMPFVPGIATPSEIERALALGRRLLKFFPAEALGGVKLLKAFAGPYAHTGVRFMPTGGVNPENLESYLALPGVAAVGGTWIARAADMEGGEWDGIAGRCRRAIEAARKARG